MPADQWDRSTTHKGLRRLPAWPVELAEVLPSLRMAIEFTLPARHLLLGVIPAHPLDRSEIRERSRFVALPWWQTTVPRETRWSEGQRS